MVRLDAVLSTLKLDMLEDSLALTIWLKPGEEVMINGARVENLQPHKIRLQFNNTVRMLRSRDRLEVFGQPSFAEAIYTQAMYLSGGEEVGNTATLKAAICQLQVAPDREEIYGSGVDAVLDRVSAHAEAGQYYEAMVAARDLIAAEQPNHPLLPR